MNVLITGCVNWSKKFFSYFTEKRIAYTFVQDERIPLKEQNINPKNFDTIICNGLFLYNDIREFTSLKVIHLTSVGFDRVPLDYIKQNNIKIFNARGVYSIPMAEYAVCGVLELYKKSKDFFINQHNKEWKKIRDIKELFSKTVCIVGCGNVGSEVALRFNAFGCKIIGVDIFEVKNEIFSKVYNLSDIKKALSLSDIVVLTLPLTKETENLFDEDKFSFMKDDSVFVNIARGKIVNEKALRNALDNKLFGAVLDVFDIEPLDEQNGLWQKENVIITPHNSFVGEGNIERLEKVIIKNINLC